MNFYKLTYTREERVIKEWFTSKRGAVVRRMELLHTGKIRSRRDAGIVPVEIPVRKVLLCDWLNQYCK